MTLDDAIELAERAHGGQNDVDGSPYFLHPLRVMRAVSPAAKVAAVLHDVAAKSSMSLDDIGGRDDEQLRRTLRLLTHDGGDTYRQHISRIASQPDDPACEVKIADLQDRLVTAAKLPAARRAMRTQRYWRALTTLVLAKRGYGVTDAHWAGDGGL